jgi:hypothetical protein
LNDSDREYVAAGELRSSVKLAKIRGGERTWSIFVACDATRDGLTAAIELAAQLDARLELAYDADERPARRVHPPPRYDDEPGEVF